MVASFSTLLQQCTIFIRRLGQLRMQCFPPTPVCRVAADFAALSSFILCSLTSTAISLGLDINCLELMTMVIACKLWGHHWMCLQILLYCDNQATVAVINSHKSRNSFMNACLCELDLLTDFRREYRALFSSVNSIPPIIENGLL